MFHNASACDYAQWEYLTGEKCLRRRRAKNHVVGFRECYWFLVRKCSREGKKNGRRLRVDRLVVFLPF